MKVAIVGLGAMGSIYGGRLASAGHEVLAVDAWADHVAAVSRQGIRVSGPDGDRVVALRAFTAPPVEVADLVVLAVKAADVPSAAASLAPLLGERTVVLTIQNGLGSADEVAEVVGPERLVVGVASGFGAALVAPGHVRHEALRAMSFGAYGGLSDDAVERVAAAWRQGGFDVTAVADVRAMQWRKLICNVAYSAPCALTGMTVGDVMDDDVMGPVSRAAAIEAWEVAGALGIDVAVEDPAALVRDFGGRMPAAKPSALVDHEHRRTSEVAVINGAVPREARRIGHEAPVNATLTALVRAKERAWSSRP